MFPCVPENADVALVGVVTVPPTPETMVHNPVPVVGVFAAKVVVDPQRFWSGPALAMVGLPVNVITTSSVVGAQGAFEVVQRSM